MQKGLDIWIKMLQFINFILARLEGMGLSSPGQSSSCGWLKALPGPVNLHYLPLRHLTVDTSLEESLPKPCIPKHLCIEWLLGSEVATTF